MTLILDQSKMFAAMPKGVPFEAPKREYLVELEPIIRKEIAAFARNVAKTWCHQMSRTEMFNALADQLEATPPEQVKLNPCVKCGASQVEFRFSCTECSNKTGFYPSIKESVSAWNAANPVTPERKDGE